MNRAELQALVTACESETLEFKKTTGERKEAAQTLCAMLNHRGGCLVFGITWDGVSIGQQVSDRTVEEISYEIQQIDPSVSPQITRIVVSPGMEVISARAQPAILLSQSVI
jgi:ATP-dependent DNA helicase RecG